jgi:hypothetical protein
MIAFIFDRRSDMRVTGYPVKMTIKRGHESWDSIYIALGFALSIEGTAISMIPAFPWNLVSYVVVGGATAGLFLFSGKFQTRLLNWKRAHEETSR